MVSCKLNLRIRDRIVDASCTSDTRQHECNGKSYCEMQCEMVSNGYNMINNGIQHLRYKVRTKQK